MRQGPAHTFGWLRRPELERGPQQVWERPDGRLFTCAFGEPFVVSVRGGSPTCGIRVEDHQ